MLEPNLFCRSSDSLFVSFTSFCKFELSPPSKCSFSLLLYFLSKLAASLAASTYEFTLSSFLFYCECLWWMSVGVVAMLRHVWFLWFLPRCLFVLFLIFFSLIWLFDLSRIKVYACMQIILRSQLTGVVSLIDNLLSFFFTEPAAMKELFCFRFWGRMSIFFFRGPSWSSFESPTPTFLFMEVVFFLGIISGPLPIKEMLQRVMKMLITTKYSTALPWKTCEQCTPFQSRELGSE